MNEIKIHNAYWLTFKGKPAACMEAESEVEARRIGAHLQGAEVVTCKRLPYPATPRLRPFTHPKHGQCPSFCFKPQECQGSTACPQPYSCTE